MEVQLVEACPLIFGSLQQSSKDRLIKSPVMLGCLQNALPQAGFAGNTDDEPLNLNDMARK